MAGWDQTPGGQPLSNDTVDEFLLDESETFLLTGDDEGGWLALGLAKIGVTGAFSQSATWSATATETEPSTAGWSQDALWDAVGQSAEDVTATAEWEQSAASWLAATSELAVGSGTWVQTQVWDADATFTPQAVNADGEWSQDQAWAAEASQVAAAPVDATGEWAQSASFAGLASTSGGVVVQPPRPSGGVPHIRAMPMVFVKAQASFDQELAQWQAFGTVENPIRVDEAEELLLIGAL